MKMTSPEGEKASIDQAASGSRTALASRILATGMLQSIKRILRLVGPPCQRTSSLDTGNTRLAPCSAAMTRIAIVAVTTICVAIMAVIWGFPIPYRLGESYPYDIRARVEFTIVNHVELINQNRERYRQEIEDPDVEPAIQNRPVFEKYPRGMLLVPIGEAIHERQFDLLREEHRAYIDSLRSRQRWSRGLSIFAILSLLTSMVALYVVRFQPSLAQNTPMITGISGLTVVTIALGMVLSQQPWNALLLPMMFTAMVLTLAYNPQFALLMTFALELAVATMLGEGLDHMLVHMGALATAILSLKHVRTRTQLVQVASIAGCVAFFATLATGSLTGQTWALIFADGFRCFLWAALSGFLLTGLLPIIERIFGFVTDVSLLELADGSHPLLQEFVRRAPGSYTHSITVATLAEAAAGAIGANPLLVRVGSYFHDVGKMLKPDYFIENQTGTNRHDVLEPALSTLVIIGHVKDGIALGIKHRLPTPIIDFIAQHHGTTLVEYFYREAKRLQEEAGQSSNDLEASFRYPGPKPQSRELGIVMLADAVESTSRSLSNPAPGSLRKLVHDMLMKRLLDGQFEESGLTLTELHIIEEALSKSLIALFHSRIKYPDATPLVKAA